jgi:xanthosine utilization system XapX-like protein
MIFESKIDSTRFVFVQEGIVVGLLGSLARVIWPTFPTIELFGFLGPLLLGAYGFKTWEHASAVASEAVTEDKKTDLAIAKIEDKKEPTDEEDDDVPPIR